MKAQDKRQVLKQFMLGVALYAALIVALFVKLPGQQVEDTPASPAPQMVASDDPLFPEPPPEKRVSLSLNVSH